MKKIINLIKLKRENTKLKKENKYLKENIYKCISDKGDFVVMPKKVFNEIWNKANDINTVFRYTGNIEDIKKEINKNEKITIEMNK